MPSRLITLISNKRLTIWIFIVIALFFHLDKIILGSFAPVIIHDTFDSDFSNFEPIGKLFVEHGFIAWNPIPAGGMPAYAHHFAPYYILNLLSAVLPSWVIYSVLVITLMIFAGYGMYRFLKDFDNELKDNFSEIPLSVTFAGGTAQRIEGTGISELYKDAIRRQEVAKLEWKNRMENLEYKVDYLQKPSKSGEFEPKAFNILDERYWCTDDNNIFQTMSSDDSNPRSLVRMGSCDDIEIRCHDCKKSYPIEGPAKHSKECTEKDRLRPLRVRTSETEWEDHPSYDKYLETKNS